MPIDKTLFPNLKFNMLVIGSSTGGPDALEYIFSQLKDTLPVPIVIVQHINKEFSSVIVNRLNQVSVAPVKLARENEKLKPGQIYIAPGGIHLKIIRNAEGYVFQLEDSSPVQSCKPSIDVFFRSLYENIENEKILSLILTGMGQDGLAGMKLLKKKNCYCITQSKDSCTIYGMPKAIEENNLSDESIPLTNISTRLTSLYFDFKPRY